MNFRYLLLVLFISAACSNAGTGEHAATIKDTASYVYSATRQNDSPVTAAINPSTLVGTYSGMLPCASCEGIDTYITLYEDQSFLMKEVYKGPTVDSFTNKGKYEVKNSVLYLKLDGAGVERPVMYTISPNSLKQLDMNGNEIGGALAPRYILTKN